MTIFKLLIYKFKTLKKVDTKSTNTIEKQIEKKLKSFFFFNYTN